VGSTARFQSCKEAIRALHRQPLGFAAKDAPDDSVGERDDKEHDANGFEVHCRHEGPSEICGGSIRSSRVLNSAWGVMETT
jgi:hypothetical protein